MEFITTTLSDSQGFEYERYLRSVASYDRALANELCQTRFGCNLNDLSKNG